MPFCVPDAPMPVDIGATIMISGSGTNFSVGGFVPNNDGISSYYIDNNGNLCLKYLTSPVKVTYTISNPGNNVGFYKWPISFSDSITPVSKITVPNNGHHHQFQKGFTLTGNTILSFSYNNDNDGGHHDHIPRFPSSQYGLNFADTGNGTYLGTQDPTINNGGND